MSKEDPYNDVTECLDWVTQPPSDILTAMNAALDARAGLSEDCD